MLLILFVLVESFRFMNAKSFNVEICAVIFLAVDFNAELFKFE